jgi:hypothetical protein
MPNTCYTKVAAPPLTLTVSPTEEAPRLELGSSLTTQDAPTTEEAPRLELGSSLTAQDAPTTEDVPCLELGSSLTAQDAPAVAAWLEQTAQAAPNHIVVDLVEVTSIDGVGLETLMQGLQRVIDAAVPPRRLPTHKQSQEH